MDFFGCILIRQRGLLRSVKLAKITRDSVLFDARHPFSVWSFLHSMWRVCVVSSVGIVLRDRRKTQIANAVVTSVSIDVVNCPIWPFTVMKNPCSMMCFQNLAAKKPPLFVTLIANVQGKFACMFCVPRFHSALRVFAAQKPLKFSWLPRQATCFSIVVDKFSDFVGKCDMFFHSITIPRCAASARRI